MRLWCDRPAAGNRHKDFRRTMPYVRTGSSCPGLGRIAHRHVDVATGNTPGLPLPPERRQRTNRAKEPVQFSSEARITMEPSEKAFQGNNPKMTCESQVQTCRHLGTPSPTTPRFLPIVCLLTLVAPSYALGEGQSSSSLKNFKPWSVACFCSDGFGAVVAFFASSEGLD
jgi:hypothetical protein